MSELNQEQLAQDINSHIKFGFLVGAFLILGVGGWASLTKITGAIIANGSLVVESSIRDVQHPNGGVIGGIFVEEGEKVEEGQLLVQLDRTVISANLQTIDRQLNELAIRRARLNAERVDAAEFNLPPILASKSSDPKIIQLVLAEKDVFELRKRIAIGKIAQRQERIERLRDEILGLKEQLTSLVTQSELLDEEVKNQRNLWESGLAAIAALRNIERQAAQMQGQRAELRAKISGLGAQISEVELQILELEDERNNDIVEELQIVESRIEELRERRVAAQDQMNRIDIKAPQSGSVVRLAATTLGGVIGAGDVIMQIVPANEGLSVEVKVQPQNIDQISIGQSVNLRFSAFAQENTPEVLGVVSRISADAIIDELSGQLSYNVRVDIPYLDNSNKLDAQKLTLGKISLVPGMPVDVFFQTSKRRVASYLLKPFSDQMERVFREP